MSDTDQHAGVTPPAPLDPEENAKARERLLEEQPSRDADAPDSHSEAGGERSRKIEEDSADRASDAGWGNRPAG